MESSGGDNGIGDGERVTFGPLLADELPRALADVCIYWDGLKAGEKFAGAIILLWMCTDKELQMGYCRDGDALPASKPA